MGFTRWTGLAVAAVVVAAGWLILRQAGDTSVPTDRGAAGVEFVVPADYAVLELGESTPEAAAERLLLALEERDRVAAVFTHAGDEIQVLADMLEDRIDERVTGRAGTVQRVLYHGSVLERLSWAREHGDFAAPGLPPPEKRNPYH